MNEEIALRDAELSSAARQRRKFIVAAAAAVVGVPLVSKLAGVMADADLLKQVVQALGYADAVVPDAAQIDARLARILREPYPAHHREFMDGRYVKQRIRHNIEADYRDGAVRVVDGWWLSHTEVECLELLEQVCRA